MSSDDSDNESENRRISWQLSVVDSEKDGDQSELRRPETNVRVDDRPPPSTGEESEWDTKLRYSSHSSRKK